MKFKPCGYNVLIELDTVEEKTKGGIILTETTLNREQRAMSKGTVIAMGSACYKNMECGVNSADDWGVKVGDKVQFPKHVYQRISDDSNSNLVLVVDVDIKGVISE